MKKWFPYLIPAGLTALLFVLLTGVLGGTFDYFFAPEDTNHDKSLTSCILELLLPLLLTGLYLPLLLLWPVNSYIDGLPHTAARPRVLFYRTWLLLAFLNPLTLLWVYSLIMNSHANLSLFVFMLLTVIASGALSAYAGILLVQRQTAR